MTKIAHISDIHFRSLKRHDEYKIVFEKLFNSLRKENVDLIFIGGDIVHSKTQGITPEIIDLLNWWFTSLCEIAPTHVILGNHDGLILNKDRQDAITPIINALNNPRLYLYKDSGVYYSGIENINWCVFSCFDEENWSKVRPENGFINIACFHGAVWGSKTDVDWELEGEVQSSLFNDFDFTFLGDIHKFQYLDKEKRIAYPGSTIQQNYGEDIKKGFLVWTINSTYDYDSKFINIPNPHPYITVDWKDNIENTFKYLEKIKSKSRFRIRSKTQISQAEIKILHQYLKNDKKAKEVIFQNLSNSENTFIAKNDSNAKNIRNVKDRKEIIDEFFADLDNDKREKIHQLFKENLDKLPNKMSDYIGNKWSINNIKFNNTFSYGKDNFINFDNLNGIVGLFGNNRAGKSSIPGSLMYALFNGTDRGSLKNIDIVNTRKGFCDASLEFTVNSNKYKLYRKTEKKTNKKGITSASTNLSLTNCNENIFQDESEEQRRETEKIIKNLIGSPEDFLSTSFAAQGEINSFIKEKSSARKSILTKFLNIDLYDDLYKLSREEYIVLKSKVKEIKEKNWDSEVNDLKLKVKNNISSIELLKEELRVLREKDLNLSIEKQKIKDNTDDSGYTLDSIKKEIEYTENKIESIKNNILISNNNLSNCNEKIEKIIAFKESYSLDSLKEQNEKLNNLLKKLNNFKSQKTLFSTELKRHKNELKILDQVPCGDQYSHCKFIKKAHDSKNEIIEVEKSIKEIEIAIFEIKGVINNIEEQQITQKITKYNEILVKEEKLKSKVSIESTSIKYNKEKIVNLNEKLQQLNNIKDRLVSKISANSIKKLNLINDELNKISLNIKNIEANISMIQQENFICEKNIESLIEEKNNFLVLAEKWKIYDLYSFAISKKGIPTSIINSSLPIINNEINNILNEVANFKITLEEINNNLEVYIDYGDSKRVIECASGMEKMMSSIAIRVALINISSLPKSDIFIIDEGFGALDDNNVEACGRLLSSLKKYFKTILVISHVDAIKDIVDKNIEITTKDKDSYVYAK